MRSNSGASNAAPDPPRSDRRADERPRWAWHRAVGAMIGHAERLHAVCLISHPLSAPHGDLGLEPLGGLHDWRGPERH